MYEGIVIWFDNKSGFGFIEIEDEKDLFVHFSDIICEGFKTIKKGQKVTFSKGVNNRGQPIAKEVLVIEEV